MDTIESTETVEQGRPRWSGRRWALTIVVVVLVLAIAVPYIYIHFVEGSAPKKLSLTNLGATGGAPVALDGAWHVTSGSQAGYRVDETLLGQHNTAVGRTDSVSGSMDVSGTTVKSATFVVDMASVKSDQRLRDRTYASRIMDTSAFPTSTFTLTKSIDFGKPPASGVPVSMNATGKLTLKGVSRTVTAHLEAEHNGGTIEVVGQIPVTFADWKIDAPVFPGVAQGQDHGTVEFLLFFTQGAGNPTPTTAATTPTTTPQPVGGRPPGGGGAPTITTSPTTVPPLGLK
jgi:polyisoprenoid-binding protein YceI